MKVCFVCLLVVLCLHGLHAACTSWNSVNRNHSRCFRSHSTTVRSHRTTVRSHRTTVESQRTTVKSPRTTVESPRTTVESPRTTVESHSTIVESQRATVKSQRTTVKSPRTTVESHSTTVESQRTTVESQSTTSRQELSSVSTAAPPCTVTWTEFENVLTTIAPHLAFEIKGIEDCKAACIQKIPGCTAIDVYPNTTICAFHLQSISELTENRFTALQDGYKQLILKRVGLCSSVSTMFKTDTASNGNVSESCTRQWKVTRDIHSAGYHTHLGVYGEEACKIDCMENIPGCVGIEVAKQVDSCNYFTQPVEELMKTRVPQEGNTQFILTHECHPTETGSSENEQPTEQPFTISSLSYTATATASKSCTAKWTEVPDVISLMFRRQSNVFGRSACEKACFETIRDCVGISAPAIDQHGSECIYYVEPLSQVVKSRIPFNGQIQFILSRECSFDLLSTVTNEIAPQNDLTIISTGTGIDVTTPTAECIGLGLWEEHKDVYSHGAALYSKVFGIDACKSACLHDIVDCVALDYHATPFCWYHTKRRDFASRRQSYPEKGFIQYVRVCSTG